jgi:hypothetical protein
MRIDFTQSKPGEMRGRTATKLIKTENRQAKLSVLYAGRAAKEYDFSLAAFCLTLLYTTDILQTKQAGKPSLQTKNLKRRQLLQLTGLQPVCFDFNQSFIRPEAREIVAD